MEFNDNGKHYIIGESEIKLFRFLIYMLIIVLLLLIIMGIYIIYKLEVSNFGFFKNIEKYMKIMAVYYEMAVKNL